MHVISYIIAAVISIIGLTPTLSQRNHFAQNSPSVQLIANASLDIDTIKSVVKDTICQPPFDSAFDRNVFKVVEQMPEYPGGSIEMLSFIMKNIKYPEAQLGDFQSIFVISFVVEPNGALSNITIRKPRYGDRLSPAEHEVLRVFRTMPQWAPGRCNGKPVPVGLLIPLRICR